MNEMTDESIHEKHFRIRGSNDLKYPGNTFRCMGKCGNFHDEVGDQLKEHRCFLGLSHSGECEFSSACKSEVTLKVDGVAA